MEENVKVTRVEKKPELTEKDLFGFMMEVFKPGKRDRLLIDLRDGQTKTAKQYLMDRGYGV